MNTTSTPLHVPELLEEADRIMRYAEVKRAYRRLNRALKHHVNVNRLLVVGDVVDDLASVGIEHRDMSVELHRRIFGRGRLAALIDQAGGVGNR